MLTCVNAIVSLYCCIYLMHGLHHNLVDCYNYLMTQNYLWQMMCTRANGDDVLDVPEGSAPLPPPCPPVSLEQMLATQNELMNLSIQNETRHGAKQPLHPRCRDMNTFYSKFLSTHPSLFSGVKDPLEADNWLRTTESKFSLLHCTKY
jgi:hypothetical protein